MIIIDGSEKSGSGTIIRDAVSFSVLSARPVRVTNIRAKRDRPGLRPQHLKVLEAAAQVCGGRLEGAAVGAREVVFRPGKRIKGMALSSHLTTRRVSQRMADTARRHLSIRGYQAEIDVLDDTRAQPVFASAAAQRGAALLLWAETACGCIIGADMAGAPKRSAEHIGTQTVENLVADLSTSASVDRYAADQLIPFAALAQGRSSYRVPLVTDHIESRLWLIERFLGARSTIIDRVLSVDGVGRKRA